MDSFDVVRGQIPVGQGCFSYGIITANISKKNSTFLYVHDCGGKIALIKKAINKNVLPNKIINALFVSHFDDDHVKGLKYLLTKRRVERAYIPLLDDTSRTIILAACKSRGIVSKELAEFVENPKDWLTLIGVETVVEVNSIQSQEQTNDADNLDEASIGLIGGNGAILRVGIRESGKTSELWRMKTFAYVDRDKDFLKKLIQHHETSFPKLNVPFQTNKDARKWLLETAEPKNIKDFLVKIGGSDHNRVSLCLFSGPSKQVSVRYSSHATTSLCSSCYPLGHPVYNSNNASGWLHTADYPFRTDSCKLKFQTHFQNEFKDVFCFMLSHHGSKADFQSDLLDWMPHMLFGLIPVGSKGQHGHPSGTALKALHRKRISPVLVMDKDSDIFLTYDYFNY